jgi:hypothetical protein
MEKTNENGAARGVTAPPFPEGHWVSDDFNGDFDITETRLTYNLFGETIYAGTREDVIPDPDSGTDGIIYIKYDDGFYSGNHYAVRWEDMTGTTVRLSGCLDAKGKSSKAAAKAEYSEANKGIYFQYGSTCHPGAEGKRTRPPKRPNEKPPFLKCLEEKTGKKFFGT